MINSVDLEVKTAQVYRLEYKGIFHFLLCIEIVLLFFSYQQMLDTYIVSFCGVYPPYLRTIQSSSFFFVELV